MRIETNAGVGMFSAATFDGERDEYRYSLERSWEPNGRRVMFLMLNPSTADAFKLDPTVRRCVDFARRWGFGGLDVCNIFALRSTDPSALYKNPLEAIGPENDEHIVETANQADMIVCAWGAHGKLIGRGRAVAHTIVSELGWDNIDLRHFAMTKSGQPRHPLYVRGDSPTYKLSLNELK